MVNPTKYPKSQIFGLLLGIQNLTILTGRWWQPVARTKSNTLPYLLRIFGLGLLLGGCAKILPSPTILPAPVGEPVVNLTRVDFNQLPGWGAGKERQGLRAFTKSCKKLTDIPAARPLIKISRGPVGQFAGHGHQWWEVCAKAQQILLISSPTKAKQFFETWFVPYQISDNGQAEGLMTGYFEPLLRGSHRPTSRFNVPLYKKPDDLVSVDLGVFKKKWNGQRIFGKVADDRLVPYADRTEINQGALKGQNLELFWVDDLVDAFFLHIQGSGRIMLPNGETVRIGYAGKNGQPYFAIGRDLVNHGEVPKDEISLQSIRSWLSTHPDKAQALMNKNKSYIFFRVVHGPGPIGAQGVPLTPGHSLAVDTRFIPLGVPLWLDTTDPLTPGVPLRRLVIAQDTGGAIKGIIRGDLFWGAGDRARQGAGLMKEKGRLYIFLPRSVLPGH